MRKSRHVKMWIKITAYLMAVSIILSQSMVGIAAGDKSQISEENPHSSKEADGQKTDTLSDGDTVDDDAFVEETDGAEDKESDENTEETVKEEIPTQIEDLETAQEELQELTEQKSILALVYLCDKYDVKDSPSIDGRTVVTVVSGQSVQIEGVDLDEEGSAWYKVSLYQQDENYTGYIEKQYLATSDEDFLGWTDEYVEEEEISPDKPKTMSIMTLSDYPDVNQFPSSYQNALLALKQKYPNWIFVTMETGLDFNTAVANEMKNDRSWISSSKPASWQNGAAAQSGWSLASEGILRYYMDPRNFLTESAIFQFEQLTYNASYHTETAVQAIIENSFMSGDIPGENMTYAGAFTTIGEELKVSPFHLASRVLQEQGTKGTSPLISGTYSGYEGYYNYFNVGASGKDVELIIKGLTEAKNRGWNTRYKSLYGGASVIGQNYILKGQDTLYLQKFNVSSNNTYNHQYMQNIMAPSSEAPSIKKAYSDTGSLNNSFVFKIPVYSNMPASACPQPDTKDTITLNKSTISNLAVDKTEKLIPYVNGSMPDNVNDMTFSSSNTDVAAVDAQGVIKAISPGKATITCARSGATSASCTVTVVKAEPVVDTPVLSPIVYKVGLKLADVSLPSGWNWNNENTVLEAGTASYPAVYTPADTTRYLTVTRQVGIKVSQAIPSCDVPENLTAKLGSKLGSITLPAGFTWESDAETILDKAGEQTFYLSYDPNDKNYLELNHIPTVVKVIDERTGTEKPDDQGGQLPDGDTDNGNAGGNNGGTSNSGSSSSGNVNSGNSGGGTTSNGSTSSGSADGSESSNNTTGNGTTGSDTDNNDSSTGGSGRTDNSANNNTGPDNTDQDSNVSGGSDSNNNNGTVSSDSTGSTGTASSGSTGSSGTASNGNTGSSGTTSNGNTGSSGTTSNGSTGSTGKTGSSSTGSTGTTGSGSATSSNNSSQENDAATNSESASNSSTTNSGSTSNNTNNSSTISNDNGSHGNDTDTSGGSTNNSGTESNNDSGTDAAIGNSDNSHDTTTGSDSTNQGNSAAAGSSNQRNSAAVGNGSSNPNNGAAANQGSTNNSGSADNYSTLPANADIAAEENTKDGEEPVYARPSVTIDMEDVSILTDEMLQMAKEQNVDLTLRMNNRASWHVDAGTVQGIFSDIDMNVLFEQNIIPQDLLADLAGENEYLEFELAHDGLFGFGAELEILLDPEDYGRYANLFYYDSQAGTLEFICVSIIDENGYAKFDMEHASGYVIVISDYPITGIVDGNETSGSALRWIVLIVVIVAILAALGTVGYFYLKRRQEDDDEEEDFEDEDDEDTDIEEIENSKEDTGEDIEKLSIEEAVPEQDGEPERNEESITVSTELEEEINMMTVNDEDDWIEDEDWQEPEKSEEKDPFADDHAEDDWIEDDQWDISNDWMDDEEWEKKADIKKTAV